MEKNWTIDEIRALTEDEAFTLAEDTAVIKDHTIYFVDFGGYFGFSCLVFACGRHIYYANDYALHHKGNEWAGTKDKTKEELLKLYKEKMNNILFTEDEIVGPVKDYDDYSRKDYFLRNYYPMRVDSVSIFHIVHSEAEAEEYRKKFIGKVYDDAACAYIEDAEFVEHHLKLLKALEKSKTEHADSFEYWKDAILREMYNHEYGYNWQADFDTLGAFGPVRWHGEDEDLDKYFEDVNFNDTQRRAYYAARAQYFKEAQL